MNVMELIQMDARALMNQQGFIWYHEFNQLGFYCITGKEYTGPF